MSDYLTKEERFLLISLRKGLSGDNLKETLPEMVNPDSLFLLAEKHSVLPLLYDTWKELHVAEELKKYLNKICYVAVQQSYRLAFLSKYLITLMEKNDIFCVVLKGSCASYGYPVPELRKSGDVDLLIEPDNLGKASKILESAGFQKNIEQHANHHVSFISDEGIEVELHTMIAEPFDNSEINSFLENLIYECKEHCIIKNIMGIEIKTLDDGFFAYQLLLHKLQHFLRAGFGLKLLCDWVVFWNTSTSEQAKVDYLNLVKESGIKGFSDVITAACVYELGLEKKNVEFMFSDNNMPAKKVVGEFLKDIIEAEEFGHSTTDRMVIMRGTGIKDYAREFHHQMKLNFPKAGKLFITWPVTWSVTMVRFLVNNKRIRNISTIEVLKKAHARSKLMKNIALFEEKI